MDMAWPRSGHVTLTSVSRHGHGTATSRKRFAHVSNKSWTRYAHVINTSWTWHPCHRRVMVTPLTRHSHEINVSWAPSVTTTVTRIFYLLRSIVTYISCTMYLVHRYIQ